MSDVKTDKDLELAGKIRTFFSKARNAKRKRLDHWRRNYNLVHNKSWGAGRDPWMPSPQASEIYPICHSVVGWMTDQNQQIDIVAASDPGSPFYEQMSQIAHDLNRVIDSLWIVKDWGQALEEVIWDGLMYGTGFSKAVWDPADDDGEGNIKFCRVDPWTVFPNPEATSMEDLEYIIEARRVSLDELERRYPGAAEYARGGGEDPLDARDEPAGLGSDLRAGSVAGHLNPSAAFGKPGQGSRGSDYGYEDGGAVLYEAWIRENELWSDEQGETYTQDYWRMIAVVGSHVLLNERAEDLWDHCGHPYDRFVLQDMGEFWGMGLVDHLASPQQSINRLLSALQSHAELCGNPVFIEDARSGLARTTIPNRPGARLKKNTGADVKWLEPPPMSPEVFQMVEFWINEMERISGLSGMVRGMTPGGRNAEGTMDSVQEAAFVRVRAMVRNLERMLRGAGQKMASLVVENYTAPRVVAVVGPEGERTAMALRGHHFFVPDEKTKAEPLKFSLWVQIGGAAPTSRQAREQRAFMLYSIGAIDRIALLEMIDLQNRAQIIQRINAAEQLGVFNPPGARQRARQ